MTVAEGFKRKANYHTDGAVTFECSDEVAEKYGEFVVFLCVAAFAYKSIVLRDDGMTLTRGGKTVTVGLPEWDESDPNEFERWDSARRYISKTFEGKQ